MLESKNTDISIQGKGDPLFLVHGIGNTKNAWDYLLPKLNQNFTTITYDLRGHGNSTKQQSKFDLQDLVEDLENIREISGFKKGHFAGHSLGGMICPAYARRFPHKVKSLGLISTAAGRTKEEKQKIFDVINAMKKNGISKILNTLVNRWFTNEFIKNHPEIIKRRLEQVLNTNEKNFLNVFRIYAETEMGPWLSEIRSPSLIITGEQDKGCNPKINQFIAKKIKNSKLIILPQYKHSLLLEAHEEVSNEIIKFMLKY